MASETQMSKTAKNTQLKTLKDRYTLAWKSVDNYIDRRPLTKDLNKIEKYRRNIISTYNELLDYITERYSSQSEENKKKLRATVEKNNKQIRIAFDILKVRYNFPDDTFAQINTNEIEYGTFEEKVDEGEPRASGSNKNLQSETSSVESDDSAGTDDSTSEEEEGNKEENIAEFNADEDNTSIGESLDNNQDDNEDKGRDNNQRGHISPEPIMVNEQTKPEFLKLAASIINYKYDGNPTKRDGFIADIELVVDVAERQNVPTCLKFIKSKLEGRALEALPENVETVQQIIDALKKDIKLEPSAVIEGRIAALRLDKGNYSKFTETAEKQIEAFRRSLVNEGITKQKSQEMAIKKTVEICRKIARSEIVKSVLAATQYDTPADVLAKFVTENDIARKEKREAENGKNNQNRNKQFDNKKKFNKNGNYKSGKNNHRNQDGGNNNQGNRNNNRNGNNNRQGQGSGQNRHRNNNNNNNNREHTIRLVQGNAPAPPAGGSQQNQGEQVFHLSL